PPPPPAAQPDDEEGDEGDAPPAPRPQPTPPPGTTRAAPGLAPGTLWPEPAEDAQKLQPGKPQAGASGAAPAEGQVWAEDWWSHARPIFEIHGYYRLRAELFHNFSLGRIDAPHEALWPMPAD